VTRKSAREKKIRVGINQDEDLLVQWLVLHFQYLVAAQWNYQSSHLPSRKYMTFVVAWICFALFVWDLLYFVLAAQRINSRKTQECIDKGRGDKSPRLQLKAREIQMKHILQFYGQKINYYIHAVIGVFQCFKVYVFPQEYDFQKMISILLTSPSLMTCLVDFKFNEDNGEATLTWEVKNARIPRTIEELSDVRICAQLHLEDGVAKGHFLEFKLNNFEIREDFYGQASVLMALLASVTHPTEHGHFNVLYSQFSEKLRLASSPQERKEIEKYERLILHGTFLNEVCNWFPSILQSETPSSYEKILTENCANITPSFKHGALLSNSKLHMFSPVTKFIVESRRLTISLMRKHKVPLDSELVFISSVLHALDHYATRFLWGGELRPIPNGKSQSALLLLFVLWMFVIPLPAYVCSNYLRDHVSDNAFYNEWYSVLHRTNWELADHITLSISF
jgi:hypothetical protein